MYDRDYYNTVKRLYSNLKKKSKENSGFWIGFNILYEWRHIIVFLSVCETITFLDSDIAIKMFCS